MQDYKPNSNRFKEESKKVEQSTQASSQDKKVEKVVTGNVTVKKKGEVRKAIDNFFAKDVQDIKTFVINDVIVPTIKNTIWDVVTNILDISLFNGNGKNRKTNNGSRVPYVSYNKYYDSKNDRRSSDEPRRDKFDFGNITLDTKQEAEEVLRQMDLLLDTYKIVTVGDLYDLVGVKGDYTDEKWGWTNLRNAYSVRTRDGYMLDLPRPIPIDK